MIRITHTSRGPAYAPDTEGGSGPSEAATVSALYPDDKPEASTNEFSEAINAEKPAAEKPADDTAEPGEGDTVPEDGKYTFTVPDGVELDAELAEAIGPELKEAGVTSAQAQKLVDKFIATQQARSQAQNEAWSETISGWVDTAKADPEIGGARWDKTVAAASGLVRSHGTPAFKEYLNASGAGNHPEMIRFMARVGSKIANDDPAIGDAPPMHVRTDAVSRMYPDDPPRKVR